MSTINIFPYPVLTPEIQEKLGYNSLGYELSYLRNGYSRKLKTESEQGATSRTTFVTINDESGNWHPDTDGLDITVHGEIMSPVFLFGPNGIMARNNSRLGIAVLWTDKEARVRGCEPVASLTSADFSDFEFSHTIRFEPGILRGILSLQIVLYVIESPGTDEQGYRYAKTEGTVLGLLDELRFVIEGSGSVFPVAEVERPNEPLWWIETYIEDPETDPFDEDHFTLYLNRAHRNYPSLHLNDGEESPLLQHIIASAIFTLITQIQNSEGGPESLKKGMNADYGSIARTLMYMIQINGWYDSLNDPEKLNKAIHRTAEKW